jgi:hypothetical protein
MESRKTTKIAATIPHLAAIPDELHHHASESEERLPGAEPSPLGGCPRETTIDIARTRRLVDVREGGLSRLLRVCVAGWTLLQ